MGHSIRKFLVVLAAGAMVSGAVVVHADASSRNGDATSHLPASGSKQPQQAARPEQAAAEPALTSKTGASGSRAQRGSESFGEWFGKHLATHPDLAQLRRELEAALAQLPAEAPIKNSEDEAAALEAIRRAEHTAGTDYRSLMDVTERFLETYPQSIAADEAKSLYAGYARHWDEHDFEEARAFAQTAPESFVARIDRYQDYLDRHGAAGRFVQPAQRAIAQIERDWADHDYRSACELFAKYPNDLATVASRLRRYLDDHPIGRHRASAEQFLARFEHAAAPGEYRVSVQSGSFAHSIGHTFSFGPDLVVELEVAGVPLGRTPVVANSYDPVWNYEFPQKVRWRMGDPIKIRVIDLDYKNRTVLLIEPPHDDPLAMRFLTGPITAEGHRLVCASDFQVPTLPTP